MIDMGKQDTFSRIIMTCGSPKTYNSPRSYTVRVSNDGGNWSKPVAMGDSCEHILDIRLKSEQTARYVRIDQQEKTMGSWGQFWRIIDIKLHIFSGAHNSQDPVRHFSHALHLYIRTGRSRN